MKGNIFCKLIAFCILIIFLFGDIHIERYLINTYLVPWFYKMASSVDDVFTWKTPSSAVWEEIKNTYNITNQQLFDQLRHEVDTALSFVRTQAVLERPKIMYFWKTLAYHRNYEGSVFAFSRGKEIFDWISIGKSTHTSVVLESLDYRLGESNLHHLYGMAQPCFFISPFSFLKEVGMSLSYYDAFVDFMTYEIWGYKNECTMHISKETLLYINDLVKENNNVFVLKKYFLIRNDEMMSSMINFPNHRKYLDYCAGVGTVLNSCLVTTCLFGSGLYLMY